jgi:membrane protease YdiL (CAAX protease family)
MGASLAISAVIFMLMHLPTRGVSYLIPTWLLGGVLYGYVYLKSGSLWVAGGTHAAHNWAADLFLYSDLAPSVFAFTPDLGVVEKMMFEVVLSLVMFGLIYLAYGRGTQLLEPSHRLQERWSVAQAEREIRVKPVPA